MFDWDDEELTNMIWGDKGETGDHIVPSKVKSEQLNKKERSEESKTLKQADKKINGNEIGLHDSKLGSSSSHYVDLSLSNAREADPDSNATEFFQCLAEPSRIFSPTREKTSELGKGPDIFHSTDESKDEGDFDEYGWAKIGSFDDLDRMFSNDVPTFGDGSLSGTDELWSSSKNVSNSPSKLLLSSILDPQDLGLDIRTEFKQQEDQPYQQNKMMKFSKMSGTIEAGAFQDMYDQITPSRSSPGKLLNQLTMSQTSLMAINLQNESQGSGTSHYSHMPNQYMAASGFGNRTNPYSTVPLVSTVQCTDVTNQFMHPSYNPTTANMAKNASVRLSTMTPQEKLEKLRRRQQMQAMLAIQRQQQQFRQQVPVTDQFITQNCPQDNDKTNLQRLTATTSFDPNSSLELHDSGNLISNGDNSSQFSALYRLQDVVEKLDMGTRTCIRDSLFRLASSAAQRHHTSDTAHSNKTSQDEQEVIPKEESRYRYSGISDTDTETVTNPTDRTVAHLLFQRPFEISAANHMEEPESPACSNIRTGEKGIFHKCSTRESRINKQKAQEQEGPAGSLALRNTPNSGSSSTVEASQRNKRKL